MELQSFDLNSNSMTQSDDNLKYVNALIDTVKEICCDGGMHLAPQYRSERNSELMIILKREVLNKNLLGLSIVIGYLVGSAARDTIYNDYEKDNIVILRAIRKMCMELEIKSETDKKTQLIMLTLIDDAIKNLVSQGDNIDTLVSLVNGIHDRNEQDNY